VINGDNPITSRAQDRLDRAPFADQVAAAIRSAPAPQGLVLGLTGPQGVGKTSLLNLIIEQLTFPPARTVLQFNPWMFSESEQLVGAFFEQIAAQLRVFGQPERQLADQLVQYGQTLTPPLYPPVAGVQPGRPGSLALKRPKAIDPITTQRRRIEETMQTHAEPVIVMLDDLDNLAPSELREVLRIVRLTGRFPRLIYLLTFDPKRIGGALAGDAADGREHLARIVEVSYDVPPVPQYALGRILTEGLQDLILQTPTGRLDTARWAEVFHRVLRPLLTTLREVNHYLTALPAVLAKIGDEVALVDVLALEAVRLRLPEVFARLGTIRGALAESGTEEGDPAGHEQVVRGFAAIAGAQRSVVEELCRLLFPATERYLGSRRYGSGDLTQWRRERRVASPPVLAFYLNATLPPGVVPASVLDLALASLTDRTQLQAVLDGLSAEDIEDLLARLESFEGEFPRHAVEPACAVLLGTYSSLRKGSTGFLDPGPELAVGRVVLRLLRRLPDPDDRRSAVEWLCKTIPSLTGKMRLLEVAGRRANAGNDRLIPAADLDSLYRALCREIRHADSHRLLAERDPLNLLAAALTEDPSDRGAVDALLDDTDFAAALLLGALTARRSHPGGTDENRADGLAWETLLIVTGDEGTLARVITKLMDRQASGDDLSRAIELVQRYLTGWRPAQPFPNPPLIVRPATNGPLSCLSPAIFGNAVPDLQLRAVTVYASDPSQVSCGTIFDSDLHQRLQAELAATSLGQRMALIASVHGIAAQSGAWEPDPDSLQHAKAAIYRSVLADQGYKSPTWLRYGILLPDQTGLIRLVADVCLSRPAAESRLQLKLEEVRYLLGACLDATGGQVAEAVLSMILPGETPRRSWVEAHVSGTPADPIGHSGTTIGEMVDFEPLGTATRPYPPVQGRFAVNDGMALETPAHFDDLAAQALLRMALDWGYLDAQQGLEGIIP
jgi:hypothetical protein